jgi:2-iminobutanoate/2-iminopropanoate deaminase
MSVHLHNPADIKASTILSYATQVGDLVFTSGLVPRDPVTGEIVDGTIGVQAAAAFDNLRRVLATVGASASDVAKVTVYLTSIADATEMNEAYKGFFGEHRPARTTVEVSSLTPGMLIEIESVIAVARR